MVSATTLTPMRDRVPAVTGQGLDVRLLPVTPGQLTYNSGMILHGDRWVLASRRYDPARQQCGIVLQAMDRDGGLIEQLGPMGLPTPDDCELEDCRLIAHGGNTYAAYTEGHYRGPAFVSRQALALLHPDFTFKRSVPLQFGGNLKPTTDAGSSEKNWQFFSHEGRMHFTYSLSPHVVVMLGPRGEVTGRHETAPPIHWPHGSMSGGTPPIRVGDRYVSFFHSYTRHPSRNRRYTMSAYCFEAKAPFGILGITRPLLTGSANDPTIPNPRHAYWNPLVIFPTGAHFDEASRTWSVLAGVNDSGDALITLRHDQLHFLPIEAWAKPQMHHYRTENPSLPVKLAARRFVAWQRVRPGLGVLRTADPDVIANIEERPGVDAIDPPTYEALLTQ